MELLVSYAAVVDGSDRMVGIFPQFALWATNIASAPQTKRRKRNLSRYKVVLNRSPRWVALINWLAVLAELYNVRVKATVLSDNPFN